jgi:hypothetical protein
MPKVKKPRKRTVEELQEAQRRVEDMINGMGRGGIGQHTALHPYHQELQGKIIKAMYGQGVKKRRSKKGWSDGGTYKR